MDGSDDASGSIDRPLLTIQAAVDASGPGDTVIVRGGRYSAFTIDVRGRADAPFTVRGAESESVVIEGSASLLSTIRVTGGAAYITVEGLVVTGTTGYRSAGVLLESITRGPITLRDLVVTENAGFGVNVYESSDVLVETSELMHNGTGIQVIGRGDGVVVRGNEIHDNDRMIRDTPTPTNDDYGAEGVTLVATSGPVLVSGNRIWGNRAPSHDYEWDGGAFSIFGASGVTISGNTIWDNENVLETGTDGNPCADNRFLRNVAWGATSEGRSWGFFLRCGENMLVAHNTIHGLDGFIFSLGDDDSDFAGAIDGMRIGANILAMTGDGKVFGLPSGRTLPPDLVIDNDLIWSPNGPVATINGHPSIRDLIALRQETSYERNGISGDPAFLDEGGFDFRLSAGSPAIDGGIPIAGLDETYAGAAPDIGRWEYVPAEAVR